MKIKVLDLTKTKIKGNNELLQIHMFNKIGLIEGKDGLFIFDYEAVGYKLKDKDEKFVIGFNPISENENTIFMFPKYEGNVTVNYLLEIGEVIEMELTEFLRDMDYNSRLSRNWEGLKKIVKDIKGGKIK